MVSVGKLAEIVVVACSLILEVAAYLSLEPWVGGARHLACYGRVQLKAGVVGLSGVEERGVRVDGVSHDELLRGLELLPAQEIRHLLADIQVPEGTVRLPVQVVVEVLPQGVPALESTWSGMEALGHDAAFFSRGRASLGLADAWEEVLCFVGFEHCNNEEKSLSICQYQLILDFGLINQNKYSDFQIL